MDLACRTETSCSRAPGPMNMSCVDERCGFPEGTPDDFRCRAAIARPTCASSTAGKGKGRARLDPGRQPLRLEPDICNLPRNPAEVNQRCLYKGMPPKLSKETRTPLHNLSWPVARAIAFDARSNGHARRCQSQHSETSQKSRGSPRVSACHARRDFARGDLAGETAGRAVIRGAGPGAGAGGARCGGEMTREGRLSILLLIIIRI